MFQHQALVWVCLVDQRRRPVINGLNLVAGQTVGPYNGKSFEVTFGNGKVDLTVNGQPVDVPGSPPRSATGSRRTARPGSVPQTTPPVPERP